MADSAVIADALSTAFMMMSSIEVAAVCESDPSLGALLLKPDSTLDCCGKVDLEMI